MRLFLADRLVERGPRAGARGIPVHHFERGNLADLVGDRDPVAAGLLGEVEAGVGELDQLVERRRARSSR